MQQVGIFGDAADFVQGLGPALRVPGVFDHATKTMNEHHYKDDDGELGQFLNEVFDLRSAPYWAFFLLSKDPVR